MSLSHKIDFAVVFSVKNANPNGDPLNGNCPRTTDDGTGEVSDVCLKRKIRDRLMDLGQEILIQPDNHRTDEFVNIKARVDSIGRNLPINQLVAAACAKWFDVRAFGHVLAFAKKDSKGKAKKKQPAEAEESPEESTQNEAVSCGIRGPVTVQSAYSLEPVKITSLQITKCTSNEGDGINRTSDMMGMKHRVDQGIYLFFGAISPQLASRTGFSDEDAEIIKGILPKLFENDSSSARPDGSMRVLSVVWWDHGCSNGKVSSAKVQASIKIDPKNGNVEITEIENGPKYEILPGF